MIRYLQQRSLLPPNNVCFAKNSKSITPRCYVCLSFPGQKLLSVTAPIFWVSYMVNIYFPMVIMDYNGSWTLMNRWYVWPAEVRSSCWRFWVRRSFATGHFCWGPPDQLGRSRVDTESLLKTIEYSLQQFLILKPSTIDYQYIYIYTYLIGGLEHVLLFPSYWECHHPNWRTPSFFKGVGIPPTSIVKLMTLPSGKLT